MKSQLAASAAAALLAILAYYGLTRSDAGPAKAATADSLLEAYVGARMEPGQEMLTLTELAAAAREPPAEAEPIS